MQGTAIHSASQFLVSLGRLRFRCFFGDRDKCSESRLESGDPAQRVPGQFNRRDRLFPQGLCSFLNRHVCSSFGTKMVAGSVS
jgi:hypothetical protein